MGKTHLTGSTMYQPGVPNQKRGHKTIHSTTQGHGKPRDFSRFIILWDFWAAACFISDEFALKK